MGKAQCSAQNGEVPDALLSRDAAASSRQRPEEILAQTLTATSHPEATDGWSSRGRRIFLIAMAAAGVVLVVAGLLVSKQLAPRTGNPAPLETGPGNGLAGQLLQQSAGDQTTSTVPGSAPLALPLPATPTTRPARAGTPSPTPIAPAIPNSPTNGTGNDNSTTVTTQPSSSTTVPCSSLLGQGIQQAVPLPCRAPTSSPIG